MGLFSRRTNSVTNTAVTENNYDQRSVVDASAGGFAGDGNFIDSSNRSITSDDDTTFIDSSNRSTTFTTLTQADPGAIAAATRMAEMNAQFLGAASGDLTDSARTMAGLAFSTAGRLGESSADSARSMAGLAFNAAGRLGDSVTDLYRTAGANNTQAWSATVGASERLTNRLLDAAQATTASAGTVAQAAISAFQPAENKAADASMRLGMIAAAAVAALLLLRKA